MPNYITVDTANQNTYQKVGPTPISLSSSGDQVLLASGATISSAADGNGDSGHGISGGIFADDVFLVLMGSVKSASSAGIRTISYGNKILIGTTGEVSGGTSGILLSDFMFGSGGNWVENWGSVKGTGATGIGIGANFSNNSLSNRGTVEGFKGIVAGSAGSSNNKVFNSGSILSSGTGVELWGDGSSLTNDDLISSSGSMAKPSDFAVVLKSNAGETITVMNTGTIESFYSEDGRAISGGLGSDRIVNYGTITGNIELGGGNDLYDDKGGTVIGEISMGDGNDSVYGSTFDAGVNLGAGDDLYDGRGGEAKRFIFLGAGHDTAFGGSHMDSLDGGHGNDWLSGGDGDDTLDLGLGDDIGLGGSGNDLFFFSGPFGADTIDGGAGVDTLAMGVAGGTSFTINLSATGLQNTGAWGSYQLSGIENVTTLDGNDLLIGSSESNKLIADYGLDTLEGGFGNDVLDGGLGFDFARFTGSVGAKVSLANTGAQVTNYGTDEFIGIEGLIGGSGADNFTGDLKANTLMGNADDDWLDGGGGDDTLDGGDGIDTVVFSGSLAATASLALGGATGHGTDTLIGIENLTGGAGADRFTGSSSANMLIGDAGSDTLLGGLGNDKLTGGSGADFFVFDTKLSKTSNVDTITDFSRVDDSFQLENAIFKKLAKVGALSKSSFVVGAKAKDKNDYIVYDKAKGVLYYDADGSGKGAAVKFAQLKKGLAIDHKDFFVI